MEHQPKAPGLPQVNPHFAGILNAIRCAPAQAAEARRAAYIAQLKAHDWGHEFSDDPRVWRAGRESLLLLRALQRELDLDGSIWDQHAPEGHRIGHLIAAVNADAARTTV